MGTTYTETVPPIDEGNFLLLKIPDIAGTDIGNSILMLGEVDRVIQQMKVLDLRLKLTFLWNLSPLNLAFDIRRWLHLITYDVIAGLEGIPGVKVKIEGLCSFDLELLCGCLRLGTVI